jgi:hypothetical protein
MRRSLVLTRSAALILLLLAACARGTAVQSVPGPAYTLEVTNPLHQPMIVSYDDGTGVHLLGTVSANRSERFVITRPASTRITVLATDEKRTSTVTRSVQLEPGAVARVSLGS